MKFDLNLIEIAEPELLFGYGQSIEHPKDGLLLYGPKEWSCPRLTDANRDGVASYPRARACGASNARKARAGG